jgi:hypothetical protein
VVGERSYLAVDMTVSCDGSTYQTASFFNAFFVAVVVVGWPAFMLFYLRKIQVRGVLDLDRVNDRVGFMFEKYRVEYMFWDVVETSRKLWLVTLVAFFPRGSLFQITSSIMVSVWALTYHCYAQPYSDAWLNGLQGTCLFVVWMTFQFGLVLQYASPESAASTALGLLIIVANISLVAGPIALGLIVALRSLCPKKVRRYLVQRFGLDPEVDDQTKAVIDDLRLLSDSQGNVIEMSDMTTKSAAVADPDKDDPPVRAFRLLPGEPISPHLCAGLNALLPQEGMSWTEDHVQALVSLPDQTVLLAYHATAPNDVLLAVVLVCDVQLPSHACVSIMWDAATEKGGRGDLHPALLALANVDAMSRHQLLLVHYEHDDHRPQWAAGHQMETHVSQRKINDGLHSGFNLAVDLGSVTHIPPVIDLKTRDTSGSTMNFSDPPVSPIEVEEFEEARDAEGDVYGSLSLILSPSLSLSPSVSLSLSLSLSPRR